jgi:hypothetical protein
MVEKMESICEKYSINFQRKAAQRVWEEVCILALKTFLQVLSRTQKDIQAEALFKALKEFELEKKPFTFFMNLADKNSEVIFFSRKIAELLEVSAVEFLENEIHRLFPEDRESISILLRKFYQFKKDSIYRRINNK